MVPLMLIQPIYTRIMGKFKVKKGERESETELNGI